MSLFEKCHVWKEESKNKALLCVLQKEDALSFLRVKGAHVLKELNVQLILEKGNTLVFAMEAVLLSALVSAPNT